MDVIAVVGYLHFFGVLRKMVIFDKNVSKIIKFKLKLFLAYYCIIPGLLVCKTY